MDARTAAVVLLVLVVACGAWAVVAAVRIAAALERMGLRTPPVLFGWLLFRNLSRYAEVTRIETGRVGPLFYGYLVPIVLGCALALAALLLATRA